jgi:hypothetical protein
LLQNKFNGWEPFITDGYRSLTEQAKLYAQGRTQPGKIVTYAKPGESPHNYGLAVDLAWRKKPGEAFWKVSLYKKLAPIARDLGFTWGGDWARFKDNPHFEMKGWREIIDNQVETPPDKESEIADWLKGFFRQHQEDINKYQSVIAGWRDKAEQVGSKDEALNQWEDFRLDLTNALKNTKSNEFKDIIIRAGELRKKETEFDNLNRIYTQFLEEVAYVANVVATAPDSVLNGLKLYIKKLKAKGGDKMPKKKTFIQRASENQLLEKGGLLTAGALLISAGLPILSNGEHVTGGILVGLGVVSLVAREVVKVLKR